MFLPVICSNTLTAKDRTSSSEVINVYIALYIVRPWLSDRPNTRDEAASGEPRLLDTLDTLGPQKTHLRCPILHGASQRSHQCRSTVY
jgi:hypothetical protein